MVALSAAAEDLFVPDLWNPYFTVSFVNCHAGDPLSDAGSTGGTWGVQPIPEDGEASVKDTYGMRTLVFVTGNESALAFSPRVQGPQASKACLYRIKFPASEAYTTLPANVKAAFTVVATNGVDCKFVGYDPSSTNWVQLVLKSGAIAPQFDFWYDCATRYKRINGVNCVSYFLKVPSGSYEQLYAEGIGGKCLFALPDDVDISMPRIMFRGSGEIGDFTGASQRGGVLTIR